MISVRVDEVARRDVRLAGTMIDIDEATGKAQGIERLLVPYLEP